MIERLLYVGNEYTATASFMSNGSPLTPSDPTLYPAYVVKDTSNDTVLFGVGTLNVVSNLYEATFTIPISSVESTPNNKWTIEWELVDSNSVTYERIEYFDVALPNFSDINYKEQQKILLSNISTVLSLPIPATASSIQFKIYDASNNLIYSGSPYKEGEYQDLYIYSVKIPANKTTAGQVYSCLWSFTTTTENSLYVKLYSISLAEMSMISDLRLFVDKVLKPLDLYLGYNDSDLYYALHNGLDYMNLITQYTAWDFNFINTSNFKPSLMMAATWWLLNSQFMAEADSSFDYSGAAVSLSVDRTGFISEQLERMKGYLDDQFALQKKHYLRGIQGHHLGLSSPTVGQNNYSSGVGSVALSRAPWLSR
jgi:hypothetical protein